MDEIRSLGAELVAISPQTEDKSRELIAKRKLGFDILHDGSNAYADQLGLRFRLPDDLNALYLSFGIDLESSNGESSQTLAMPARYTVAADGSILYSQVHPDYTRRPEVEDSLGVLRAPG